MRYPLFFTLFLVIILVGCGSTQSQDAKTYSYINRGIGSTGIVLEGPPDINSTQETWIVAKNATITYWSPYDGWRYYDSSVEFLILPGQTIYLGITPKNGYYTANSIINVTFTSATPVTIIVDVVKTVAN
jgi:hypothetical protein